MASRRRFAASRRRANVFENLESRRLLSAATSPSLVDSIPVENITWTDAQGHDSAGPAVADQWIVQLGGYKGTVGSQLMKARRYLEDTTDGAIDVGRYLLKPGQFTVTLDSALGTSAQYALLSSISGFVSASPDWVMSSDATPNDPSYFQLWGLHNTVDTDIDAPEAWNITTGSMTQIVGVVDSGVEIEHVDLYQNVYINEMEIPATRRSNLVDTDGDGVITFYDLNNPTNQGAFKITDQNADGRISGADLRATMGTSGGADTGTGGWDDNLDNDANALSDDLVGWDFLSNDNNPADVFGHGTHVAGTVGAAGNNSVGVVGVNWRTRILGLRTGGATVSDNTINTSAAIAALNYALSLKMRGEAVAATNNSWGSSNFNSQLADTVTAHETAGIMFVAAAGNNGVNNDLTPHYPSSYANANVIAVANAQQNGARNPGSNFGKTSVDLAAPGTGILSTVPGNAYGFMDGTSMASPHVAGAVALLKGHMPSATNAFIKAVLLSNIDPQGGFTNTTVSGGRLNINKGLLGLSLTPPPATDLDAGSDTGASSTDNVTNDNSPTFSGTATPNSTIRLLANGQLAGLGTSDVNGNYSVTSNVMLDGTYGYEVAVSNGVANSAGSPPISVQIDTIAPTASNGTYPFNSAPQRTTFVFSENMELGFTLNQVTVLNLTTGNAIPAAQMSFVYNPSTNQTDVRFSGGLIPDGNYRVTVVGTDLAGNTQTAQYQYTFFLLYGDGDRNRLVDISDFSTMSSNFNTPGIKVFSQGDYNYDGTVGIGDFSLLASRFNTTLPPAASLPDSAVAGGSPFSAKEIDDRIADEILVGDASPI